MVPVSYPEVRAADPAPRGRSGGSSPRDQAVTTASALHAVQVALDRRDNGGDAGPAGDEQAGPGA
ncbi:MAG TPA: hypothetical protein VF162_13230 [Streptosporangiaceae bacterium]